MVVIDRIRGVLKESGRTQAYLAAQLGLGRSYLNDLEKRGAAIPTDRLEAIAEILDVSPAYLRGETDQKEKPTIQADDELLKDAFVAFYGDVKPYFDEDDINDIKIFMQMKAEYKKKKNDKG